MMQNNLAKKISIFIQAEKRLFIALAFLSVVFLVNDALYAGHPKTVEFCAGGKCLSLSPEKSQLPKESTRYYVDDLFKNQPSAYYRLTFQGRASVEEKLSVKLTSAEAVESPIGELALYPSDKFQNQEMLFFLPEGFSSLVFQRDGGNIAGNVFLQSVAITKLNISRPEELASLKQTQFGEADTRVVMTSQSDSKAAFLQLKEPKMLLGQFFRAKDSLISAVSLRIDINKNINPGSRQYVLSLREVNYDGKNISSPGAVIVDSAFSLNSIEKYRDADGSFLFPIFAKVEKDKYYLISLDNSKVNVSEQNYLEVLGSNDSSSYLDGSAVVKKNKEWSLLDGDLCFKIFSAELTKENGAKILGGAKIEDLGKGIGHYSYATKGTFTDLFDLDSASFGTEFSESDKVIYAPAKDNASFSYAVNMLYPISKLNFSATKLKAGWKDVKVSYSFDQNSWTDLNFSKKTEIAINSAADPSVSADSTDMDDGNASVDGSDQDISVASSDVQAVKQETVQVFDADIVPAKEARTVYFKISYDQADKSKGRYFALKNLKITAELKMQ